MVVYRTVIQEPRNVRNVLSTPSIPPIRVLDPYKSSRRIADEFGESEAIHDGVSFRCNDTDQSPSFELYLLV